jgi:hypothetical protein
MVNGSAYGKIVFPVGTQAKGKQNYFFVPNRPLYMRPRNRCIYPFQNRAGAGTEQARGYKNKQCLFHIPFFF